MSNWLRARVSTEIKNPRRDLFEKALDDMGYVPDYTQKVVHGAYSSETAEGVDCVLREKNTGRITTIGFNFRTDNKGETVLAVTGDFWRSRYDGEGFMKQLGMFYNHEKSREWLEENGYTIEDVEVKEHEVVMIGRMAA